MGTAPVLWESLVAQSQPAESAHRGRQADRPREIPTRGWRDILLRVKDELGKDNVGLIAAGIAFYSLLALFPAIAAAISLWALAFDPLQIEQQMESASGFLPQDAARIIHDQGRKVAGDAGAGLSLAAIGGLLLAIYSSAKGVKALIMGLNVVYDENEKRGFIKLNIVALGLTLIMILAMILSLAIVIVIPVLLELVGLSSAADMLISLARWPILFALAMFGLAILYRYAPSRKEPRWRWVSPGALTATALWVLASLLFSVYVRNFGNYNETYGSLGAVVILLMWLWLSAYIVLLGAEINAETEHQTKKDSTEGEVKPMGQRGAYVADTVGEKK